MKYNKMERLIAWFRYEKVISVLKKHQGGVMVDIGCGTDGTLLNNVEQYLSVGYGFDRDVPVDFINDGSKIKLNHIDDLHAGLDLADESADNVTLLAVFEHLEKPEVILAECHRILKPGGRLICTVPTWMAKPILEFMAFKLKVIDVDSIEDHKRYYSKKQLREFAETKFTTEKCQYFELGVNCFGVFVKD
ncbi:MAG: class I SAM-dependent methyltransferase [Lactobacillales bacterium]|jgi:ubiquinone/menaquinone biosynthesis C-methylase UbiE|nr:class I SAM-dependent methyltransferase [Lactobacillales bacterium]